MSLNCKICRVCACSHLSRPLDARALLQAIFLLLHSFSAASPLRSCLVSLLFVRHLLLFIMPSFALPPPCWFTPSYFSLFFLLLHLRRPAILPSLFSLWFPPSLRFLLSSFVCSAPPSILLPVFPLPFPNPLVLRLRLLLTLPFSSRSPSLHLPLLSTSPFSLPPPSLHLPLSPPPPFLSLLLLSTSPFFSFPHFRSSPPHTRTYRILATKTHAAANTFGDLM